MRGSDQWCQWTGEEVEERFLMEGRLRLGMKRDGKSVPGRRVCGRAFLAEGTAYVK